MEYRLGNNLKVKERGVTASLKCPECGKMVNLSVFSNLERHLAVKPIPFDVNTVYFLVCPECAAIYTVDEEKGEGLKHDLLAITDADLKKPKQFKPEI